MSVAYDLDSYPRNAPAVDEAVSAERFRRPRGAQRRPRGDEVSRRRQAQGSRRDVARDGLVPRPLGVARLRTVGGRGEGDGQVRGRIGLLNPEGWPGLEVAWTLARDRWGNGFATEGAKAALDYAFSVLKLEH